LAAASFRDPAEWDRVRELAGAAGADTVPLARRFPFDPLKIVPADWRRDLLQLVVGSHDPWLQEHVNRFAPVQVFNLSITQPAIIEDTHRRMKQAYHADGGPWGRGHMPRTTFVFLNEQPGLTPEGRRAAARAEARGAMRAYWTALQGTIDPAKVDSAADNALVGNADDVAEQIVARFHRDDRLMLWFDFFNHDADRVCDNMRAFVEQVIPRVEERLTTAAD
jgi:hypothetical protein